MKVLITNQGLDGIAGSETFCYTLISELVKRGSYEIECFTSATGQLSGIIEQQFGIKSFSDISLVQRPDVIHANHRAAIAAHERFPDVPIVFVSHGIIEDESVFVKPCKLFVVSEEVQLLRGGGQILRNGIDLERFKPMDVEKKRDALYIDRHTRIFDMPTLINESCVVLAKGRGALEAMACNVPTILLSRFGFGGLITEENFHHYKTHNFSARNAREGFSYLEINKALSLKKYEMRSFIEREFGSKEMADILEKAYREAVI